MGAAYLKLSKNPSSNVIDILKSRKLKCLLSSLEINSENSDDKVLICSLK